MIRVLCVAILLLLGSPALAVTDDFVVTQLVGDDSVAPSTPAFITAVPVAITQIDLAWGTSTDDQLLAGYRLFRDAVQIATTTTTTYSDTGLTASTTYTYTVDAYDWFFNISSTSSSTATTTFALPVTPVATATPNTAGGNISPRLISLEINPDQESVVFSWQTNIYTRYILRWGRTSSYNLGSLQNEVFSRSHETTLRDLSPDTQYSYELIAVNQLGHEKVFKHGTFTTTEAKDLTAPANVTQLRAVVENTSVYLQWVNPIDPDFTKVRVVRNYLFYPNDPADGFIVYEGTLQSVLDEGVLFEYPNQYYTVFAYDENGNISSGAIVMASRGTGESMATDTTLGTNGNADITDNEDGTDITFDDIRFIQEKKILTQEDRSVVVNSALPLGIQMPAHLLPLHLKTIAVTLKNQQGELQTYILRSNREKTMYEALLRGLPQGVYGVTFTIYDYQTQVQTVFTGSIRSEQVPGIDADNGTTQTFSTPSFTKLTTYGILFAFPFLFWWFILLLRRSEDE